MKTFLILSMMLLNYITAEAQLSGSGKLISKTYDYKDFDKIYCEDLAGYVHVRVGKPFAIKVDIDDNLADLLEVRENSQEHELKLRFKDNKNNKKYIENTNIQIIIELPEVSVIRNSGNSDLVAEGIMGRYFRIENSGNGDTTASGTIDRLDVVKSGNGNLVAGKLLAKQADIKSSGNGDVIVNVTESIHAELTGNGNITNKGKAAFDAASTKSGNGDLLKS